MTERYSDDRQKYRSLFCTREQGDRILELTGVYPMNFWVDNEEDDRKHGFMESVYDLEYVEDSSRYKYEVHPAYTLQELRDLLDQLPNTSTQELGGMILKMTAPDLAEWVIQRLGGGGV